jgi:hypothetical protein
MVEADSHLELLPTSIVDIYKVLEQIGVMSMGILKTTSDGKMRV